MQCSWWGQCGVSELYCERAVRQPPAGATATVKPVTAEPAVNTGLATNGNSLKGAKGTATGKTGATQDNGSKKTTATKMSTTTKAVTKATTTKAKTKAKATTTTKKTVEEKPVQSWNAPWEMTLYAEKGCKGDYYHLEGYNQKLTADKDHCLVLRGGLNSEFTETGVTCKFWTDDGFTWMPCDKGTLKSPQSWIVKEGFCRAFEGKDCYCLDHYDSWYDAKGCVNKMEGHDPPTFGSMMCAKEMVGTI
jgi:hypothetical protein